MKTSIPHAKSNSQLDHSPLASASPWGRTLCISMLAMGALIAMPRDVRAVALPLNGNFATSGGSGQLTVNTTLANWTGGGVEGTFGSQSTPPVFVFSAGTTAELSSTGVNGDAFMGNVKFYNATGAPGGGAVVAAMGDPDWRGTLSQTLNGLSVGGSYFLTFNWAGAQQQGFSNPTTEKWQVTFGSSTQSTSVVNTPSQNFAGWQTGSMTFTATSASQLLNFQAVGTPGGSTPWLLLNNVQMAVVPEPSSMLMLGLGSLIPASLWRRRRPAAAV